MLECYELGRYAFDIQDYYHSIIWLNYTLFLLENEEKDENIDISELIDNLAYSYEMVIFCSIYIFIIYYNILSN